MNQILIILLISWNLILVGFSTNYVKAEDATDDEDPLENYKSSYMGVLKFDEKCTQPFLFEVASRYKDNEEKLKQLNEETCSREHFLECYTDRQSPGYDRDNLDKRGTCGCSALVGGKNAIVDSSGTCRIPAELEFDSVCDDVSMRLPYSGKIITGKCTENSVCHPNPLHIGRRCYCSVKFESKDGQCGSHANGRIQTCYKTWMIILILTTIIVYFK